MALEEITDELVGIFKDPAILIGIPLALLGAVYTAASRAEPGSSAQATRKPPGATVATKSSNAAKTALSSA